MEGHHHTFFYFLFLSFLCFLLLLLSLSFLSFKKEESQFKQKRWPCCAMRLKLPLGNLWLAPGSSAPHTLVFSLLRVTPVILLAQPQVNLLALLAASHQTEWESKCFGRILVPRKRVGSSSCSKPRQMMHTKGEFSPPPSPAAWPMQVVPG